MPAGWPQSSLRSSMVHSTRGPLRGCGGGARGIEPACLLLASQTLRARPLPSGLPEPCSGPPAQSREEQSDQSRVSRSGERPGDGHR